VDKEGGSREAKGVEHRQSSRKSLVSSSESNSGPKERRVETYKIYNL
jgi:hypothetical protein